jgi:ABC-2 type transport system permease protein
VIGLIRSEALRFISRRLFRFLALAVAAGIVAAAVIAFVQSSKDPNAALAEANRVVADCERSIADAPAPPPGEFPGRCPTTAQLAPQFDKRFRYAETMPDATRGVAVALFVLSFVVAASFVGADWASGTTTTLLTWEPRRGRVLVAKLIAAGVLEAIAVGIALALLAVTFLPVAALRGTTAGLDGSMWWTLLGLWSRGAGLALFAVCCAGGIATVTRNTAGAIGAAFGYAVILDPILAVIRGGRLRPWLLQHLLPRFLGIPIEVPQGPSYSGGIQSTQLSMARPVILLSIYAALIVAGAYAVFRTRDVT